VPPPSSRVLPTTGDCDLEAAGYGWDAIRAPLAVGREALRILGHRSGAAIEDPAGHFVYWFVAPGTAATWALCDTTALGRGVSVVVPREGRTFPPGPHWRIRPGDGGRLTDPGALMAALQDAMAAGSAS